MLELDVVIFGGGIAGLWTLSTLTKLGYKTLLVESNTIGGGQTIKSQGIIHGGLKYALDGKISSAVTSLYDMPRIWQQCLSGTGILDLKAANVLSTQQHMWSVEKLSGAISTLFASKSLKSHVLPTPKDNWPCVISTSNITSKLYQLSEHVLDIHSVITSLGKPLHTKCLKMDNDNSYEILKNEDGSIKYITVYCKEQPIKIRAQKYVFTAGSGNAQFIENITQTPSMQLRPLHMVLLKDKNLSSLYGHCINLKTIPRITITTHYAKDGTPVWYLGGKIAEDGVERNSAQQIDFAKKELLEIFPNLSLTNAKFATFYVDRAEAKQNDGKKPNSATIYDNLNSIVAWPTKLAFAPIVANTILDKFAEQKIIANPELPEIDIPMRDRPLFTTNIWDTLL